jgi:histidine triad (HIT) family protein
MIAGIIPAKVVEEGQNFLSVHDINPQAPVHVLIMPREHSANILDYAGSENLNDLFIAAKQIASKLKLDKGFRLVINTGDDGGQTVNHLHIHLLGGRQMQWPPG